MELNTKTPRRRRPKTLPGIEGGAGGQVVNYTSYSKAVARVLDVLECFPDEETSLSMTEISRLGKFPESSLFRILYTLTLRGYLCRSENGVYRLAPRLVLGKLRERANIVREAVHPLLKQLSTRFDETASAAFLFVDKVEVIDTVTSFHEIGMSNAVGRVVQPHASSLGKAITAFQSKQKIDNILQVNGLHRRTEKTVVDRPAILAEFERIRKQGYAEDNGESVLGAHCYGAPLHDEKGRVTAALSVAPPSIRITQEREQEMIQAVLEAGQQGSQRIQEAVRRSPGRGGGQ